VSAMNCLGDPENLEIGLGAKKTRNLISKRKRISKQRVVRLKSLSLPKRDSIVVYVYITASKHEVKRVRK
jgi:hypothetical protein